MLHTKKRSKDSLSDEWETPPQLMINLCEIYNVELDLDVCATQENTKCFNFFTKEDDGLSKSWVQNAWVNPPHSKTGDFVRKSYEQWQENNIDIMLLIPTNTMSSQYWHEYIEGNAEYHPIKGRINFLKDGVKSPHQSRNAYVCVIFHKH
tara:strand:- start:535 stop:984 length:450 start_codon:yes stop_codon:yes gene_type:complete